MILAVAVVAGLEEVVCATEDGGLLGLVGWFTDDGIACVLLLLLLLVVVVVKDVFPSLPVV
jgi:hypothetical protein